MTAELDYLIRQIAKSSGQPYPPPMTKSSGLNLSADFLQRELQKRADRDWDDKIVGDGTILSREGYRQICALFDELEQSCANRNVADMINGIYNTLMEYDAKQEGSVQVYDGY